MWGNWLLAICSHWLFILPLEWRCRPKIDVALNGDVFGAGPEDMVGLHVGIGTDPACLACAWAEL